MTRKRVPKLCPFQFSNVLRLKEAKCLMDECELWAGNGCAVKSLQFSGGVK